MSNEVNPSKPQWEILTSQKQVNLFLAGQGSGKTHCAGLLSGNLITTFPNVHGFIGANTYVQLSDSTLFRIRKVWKEVFGWTEWSRENPFGEYVVDIIPPLHFNIEDHEYDSYHGKICFRWGTVVYKGSLDNYQAHDGKEFGWGILDETKDTKEEAVKEVIMGRLREKGMFVIDENKQPVIDDKGEKIEWNPLFIFSSPAKVKWINEWFNLAAHQKEIVQKIYLVDDFFHKQVDNKLVVISSTYHNQKNLPNNFIDNQKKNINTGLQGMLIYGNPFSQTGGEYYKTFDRMQHVGGNKYANPVYEPKDALHFTWDFNIRPYMTAIQGQVFKADNVWWLFLLREVLTYPPYARTRQSCRDVRKAWSHHKAGGFVYGDHTKKAGQTELDEKYDNAYDIVYEEMRPLLSMKWDRVKFFPVHKRQEFVTSILEERIPVRLLIHSSMVETINDFVYTKEDPRDGGKLKEKTTDEATGKTYEKVAHCLDAVEYLACSLFEDYM